MYRMTNLQATVTTFGLQLLQRRVAALAHPVLTPQATTFFKTRTDLVGAGANSGRPSFYAQPYSLNSLASYLSV